MILLSQKIKKGVHFKEVISYENFETYILKQVSKPVLKLGEKVKQGNLQGNFKNILFQYYKIYQKGTIPEKTKATKSLLSILKKVNQEDSKSTHEIETDEKSQTQREKMTPACVMQSMKEDFLNFQNEVITNQKINKTLSNEGINTNKENINLMKNEEEKLQETKVSKLVELGEREKKLERFWYYPKKRQEEDQKEWEFKSFKVMTFNALAQSLVDYKYLENDQTTMSWAKRREEIIKVIEESDCEVVCLQEIDEIDYINFFKSRIERMGYEGVYKRKLQNRLDGILTMYKKERYELVLEKGINFSSENEEFDKPQVALILGLKDKLTKKVKENENENKEGEEDILLVSNTHLIFNKSRGDIKLYQLCNLLQGVKEACEELRNREVNTNQNKSEMEMSELRTDENRDQQNEVNPSEHENEVGGRKGRKLDPNILICGDFNLTPQSLIYNLLFNGFAPLRNSNPKCISGQYLMFEQTYLTSSSGHNESGETMGSVRHYLDHVYKVEEEFRENKTSESYNKDRVVMSKRLTSEVEEEQLSSSDSGQALARQASTIDRIKAMDVRKESENAHNLSNRWYEEVLKSVQERMFAEKPEYLDEKVVKEFVKTLQEYLSERVQEEQEIKLSKDFKLKLKLESNNSNNNNNNNNNNNDSNSNNSSNSINNNNSNNNNSDNDDGEESVEKEVDLIYCPFNLKSAYSVDDGFNCEPAFTAFHGWQKGCVDYICYSPEKTVVEGIYEMPLYAQVKRNGDLPHKKWPASDHFSLVSQLRRVK